jgi:hypothetical protein
MCTATGYTETRGASTLSCPRTRVRHPTDHVPGDADPTVRSTALCRCQRSPGSWSHKTRPTSQPRSCSEPPGLVGLRPGGRRPAERPRRLVQGGLNGSSTLPPKCRSWALANVWTDVVCSVSAVRHTRVAHRSWRWTHVWTQRPEHDLRFFIQRRERWTCRPPATKKALVSHDGGPGLRRSGARLLTDSLCCPVCESGLKWTPWLRSLCDSSRTAPLVGRHGSAHEPPGAGRCGVRPIFAEPDARMQQPEAALRHRGSQIDASNSRILVTNRCGSTRCG